MVEAGDPTVEPRPFEHLEHVPQNSLLLDRIGPEREMRRTDAGSRRPDGLAAACLVAAVCLGIHSFSRATG